MMMGKCFRILPAICILTALVGCGASDPEESGADAMGQAESANIHDTAAQCPPRLAASDKVNSYPTHDIVGIELGMRVDDVQKLLACRDPKPEIIFGESPYLRTNTHDIELRSSINTFVGPKDAECVRNASRYLFDSGTGGRPRCEHGYRNPNPDRMHIVFTGLPGKERVRAIWRNRYFEEGTQPPVEAVRNALSEKYGEPHYVDGDLWVWSYDLLNRPMSDRHRRISACRNHPRELIASGSHILGDCGVTIRASVSAGENKLLAQRLNIATTHHKDFVTAQTEFQQALDSEKQRRDAEQLKRSDGNSQSAGDL